MPKRKTADSEYQNLIKDLDLAALKKTQKIFLLNSRILEKEAPIQHGFLF